MQQHWPYACVYKIVHRPSGKFYIGSTVNRLKRWQNHRTKSTCIHLRRAIVKYGLSQFDFLVLSSYETLQTTKTEIKTLLTQMEQEYLDKFYLLDSKKNPKCYNANPVANHGNFTNHQPSIDTVAVEFVLESPDGVRHIGKNLSLFARDHGLIADCLTRVHRGERRHHKGWHLPGVDWRKTTEPKTLAYRLQSPGGKTFIGKNLTEFCQEHNLSRTRMFYVFHGKQRSHKGWTVF